MARNANGKPGDAVSGLEAWLWTTADALQNNMDAAEYKHGNVLSSGRYVGAEAVEETWYQLFC
jgi:hypothetical protein